MMTLRQLAAEPPTIPTRTSWYLTDLAEARGKQELFTRQSPQKLKVLRDHALIESTISSNRIEGVEVDKFRVATLIFGKTRASGSRRRGSARLPRCIEAHPRKWRETTHLRGHHQEVSQNLSRRN